MAPEPRGISAPQPEDSDGSGGFWEDFLVAVVRFLLRLYLLPFLVAGWLVLNALALVSAGILALERRTRRAFGVAEPSAQPPPGLFRRHRMDLPARRTGLRPKGHAPGAPEAFSDASEERGTRNGGLATEPIQGRSPGTLTDAVKPLGT